MDEIGRAFEQADEDPFIRKARQILEENHIDVGWAGKATTSGALSTSPATSLSPSLPECPRGWGVGEKGRLR